MSAESLATAIREQIIAGKSFPQWPSELTEALRASVLQSEDREETFETIVSHILDGQIQGPCVVRAFDSRLIIIYALPLCPWEDTHTLQLVTVNLDGAVTGSIADGYQISMKIKLGSGANLQLRELIKPIEQLWPYP